MSADNMNTLAGVAIEVMERYAFLTGEAPGVSGGAVGLPESLWIITVAFAGPRTGRLGMAASPALARQLMANLYGDTRAGTDGQSQDAVKELLNIICGSYLHRVEGDDAVFTLAAPALRVATRQEAAARMNGKPQAALVVEGHSLVLFVEL